jgi:hypothetical protein
LLLATDKRESLVQLHVFSPIALQFDSSLGTQQTNEIGTVAVGLLEKVGQDWFLFSYHTERRPDP